MDGFHFTCEAEFIEKRYELVYNGTKGGGQMLDNNPSNQVILIGFGTLLFTFILICILYRIFKNPFQYPYYVHVFDVTSKRNIKIDDYIDNFLCDYCNWSALQLHEQHIQQWKTETQNYIQNCRLRKYRTKQYQAILDDKQAYHFQTIRIQTRYRQQNYIKTAYKVSLVDGEWTVSWSWLTNRYKQLEKIRFESTLNEYNSQCQRKLMTPLLRKKIMERDRYTCQNCGKYMPDEVGLHIDHIIPIAKGGKSVASNLRVLCSKCNGSKGAK